MAEKLILFLTKYFFTETHSQFSADPGERLPLFVPLLRDELVEGSCETSEPVTPSENHLGVSEAARGGRPTVDGCGGKAGGVTQGEGGMGVGGGWPGGGGRRERGRGYSGYFNAGNCKQASTFLSFLQFFGRKIYETEVRLPYESN